MDIYAVENNICSEFIIQQREENRELKCWHAMYFYKQLQEKDDSYLHPPLTLEQKVKCF